MGDSSYTLSYTGPFADLSEDEFIAMYTGLNQPLASEDSPALSVDDSSELEDAVDWTTRGAVNAIKNQGQCGSCWAFSTVGTLESAWQISTGTLYSLAEQQLVDCDRSDNGCSGGWPHTAYDSYISRAGYCSEDSYIYTARDGSCRASSCDVKLAEGSVTGHQNVAQRSSGLKSALAKQPVSVTVNAGQLQLYANGVVSGDCRGLWQRRTGLLQDPKFLGNWMGRAGLHPSRSRGWFSGNCMPPSVCTSCAHFVHCCGGLIVRSFCLPNHPGCCWCGPA